MSGTAKLFVVVNLIAALLFVGATATYLAQRERERQELDTVKGQYEDLKKSSTGEQARLTAQVGNLEKALAAETDSLARANDNLQSTTAKLEMERKNNLEQAVQLAELQNTYGELRNDLSRALAAVDDQRKELVTLRTTAQEAMEAKEQAVEEARVAKANAASAIAQWRSTAKQLKQVQDSLGRFESRYPDPGGVTTPAQLYGKITQVNGEYNRVEVSLGEDDGVMKGMEFTVYRPAPSGGYVGTVIIENVDKERSIARVATALQGELGEVKVHDNVSAAF